GGAGRRGGLRIAADRLLEDRGGDDQQRQAEGRGEGYERRQSLAATGRPGRGDWSGRVGVAMASCSGSPLNISPELDADGPAPGGAPHRTQRLIADVLIDSTIEQPRGEPLAQLRRRLPAARRVFLQAGFDDGDELGRSVARERQGVRGLLSYSA